MNSQPTEAGTPSAREQWMEEAAREMNEIQAARGHVLRANNGETNPVMTEREMVEIIARHAAVRHADPWVRELDKAVQRWVNAKRNQVLREDTRGELAHEVKAQEPAGGGAAR